MTTQILDDATRSIFSLAGDRHLTMERLYRETQRDAKIIAPKLIGKHIVKDAKRYEITDVDYRYDGTISARGYRILGNGKRGSQKWDIGFICAGYFDAAAT